MELKDSVIVRIIDEDYTIKFPNAGQQMEIENKKMFLSDKTYRDQVLTGTRSAKYNLMLMDALAHFSVLIPNLGKKLGVENYLELPPFTAKQLVIAYKNEFSPWYQEFLRELYKGIDEEETTDQQDGQKGTEDTKPEEKAD